MTFSRVDFIWLFFSVIFQMSAPWSKLLLIIELSERYFISLHWIKSFVYYRFTIFALALWSESDNQNALNSTMFVLLGIRIDWHPVGRQRGQPWEGATHFAVYIYHSFGTSVAGRFWHDYWISNFASPLCKHIMLHRVYNDNGRYLCFLSSLIVQKIYFNTFAK